VIFKTGGRRVCPSPVRSTSFPPFVFSDLCIASDEAVRSWSQPGSWLSSTHVFVSVWIEPEFNYFSCLGGGFGKFPLRDGVLSSFCQHRVAAQNLS
jgi:hypothetical protein